MSRPITVKRMQQHIECVCGHNEVIPDEWKMTEAYCRKLGYRKKVDTTTGKPFWFRYAKIKECQCNEWIGYEDLYPTTETLPDPEPITEVITEIY